MYDIIVIGSGPAGLTAALYARRAGKSVLVIEKASFGGQVNYSPKIENYPGSKQISGSEFADKFVDQVMSHGGEFEFGEVVDVTDNGQTKTVKTDSDEFEGKTVIIAAGVKHRHLGVPGEEKFSGEGVSYCAICDGDFLAGRDVVVVGGGNSAFQDAILLSEKCKSVTMVQDLPYFTGEASSLEVLKSRNNVKFMTSSSVLEFKGEDKLESVVVRHKDTDTVEELKTEGAFVAIGLVPDNKAFAKVVDLDERGYIASDETCLTKTPGVYVAGDCRTKRIRQITTAVADGSVAALAAVNYIDKKVQ
jgi:thioredoxin reductase (NADPH)